MATRDRLVVDVNVFAIFLVENHPGHRWVASELEKGLKGMFVPVILDIVPVRAYWIMTRRWDCDPVQSEKAVRHFLDSYPMVEYASFEKEMIHEAFDLARELRHDVFDTVYLAAALRNKASGVMTTDAGFRRLCPRKGLRYLNPVPQRILQKFAGWKSTFGSAKGVGPFTHEDEMRSHE